MIEVDVQQGTEEWREARAGIPTASRFDEIITPSTMKLSKASAGYRYELLAEWMLGTALDDGFAGDYAWRGTEMEADAVRYYELQRNVSTRRIGLVLADDRQAGCSPDRLVGVDGGLEIKCPGPGKHVGNLIRMTQDYRPQVQGCLWLTGRRWWDLLSFHADLPAALVRVERDETFIAALAKAVGAFQEQLREDKALLISEGYIAASAALRQRAAGVGDDHPF